jgi:hypothetical protein
MFDLLWRKLRKNNVGPSGGEKLPKQRHTSFRPQLEALEDRMMPTLLPGVFPPIATPTPPPAGITGSGSSGNLQTLINPPASSVHHMVVVPAMRNSSETVINLDRIFAQQSGLQHEDGLQWSMLGNTNAALVRTDLSEAELTLKYTPGRWGIASVMVGATDADGVCEREIIHVFVSPWAWMSIGSATQPSAGAMVSPHTVAAV